MPGHEHRPGLGLGLALVEALARAHGGRLELSSNTPQGLVATIWLPLNSRQADQSTDP
jgi:signal transduction histidine kinase